MTYPQSNPNQYAVNGYPFYREITDLLSPGDIYESEQGAHAIALGPESDVARVRVTYLDDQNALSRAASFVVSPDRAFIGATYARNETQYRPGNRPGRLLMAVDNVYQPDWRPPTFNVGFDEIQFITPKLDIIQFFKPPSGDIARSRFDREYLFQTFQALNDPSPTNELFTVFPYWGRRSATFTVKAGANGTSVTLRGVKYDFLEGLFGFVTTLVPATGVAAFAGLTYNVVAGTDGLFDALCLSVTRPDETGVRVFVSDHSESKGT